MYINESRGGPNALGYLALQHHNYSLRYDLDERVSCWGVRVLDHEIGNEELGHYVHDEDTFGDIIGAFHWPGVPSNVTGASGRQTGAWSWIYPAVNSPGQRATTGPFGEVTPGLRTPTDGPPVIPAITQGPGVYLGDGKWTEGTTVAQMRDASRTYFGRPGFVATNGPGGAVGPGGAGGSGGAAGGAPGQGGAGAGVQLWNPDFPQWQGVQADVGVPVNVPLFGFGGPPLGIKTQGLFADTPQVAGGLFGIGGPLLLPVFLPGFLPDQPKKPKLKTPNQTANWLSDFKDIDDRDDGDVRTDGPILPLRDEQWEPDNRFEPITSQGPEHYPTYPRGFNGIVVQATEENRQVSQFHPTDPRLIAPQIYGDPRSGTIVAEPNEDGILDGSRQAHLQSMMRVVPDPKGIGKEGEDALSWQISKSPRRDVSGGLFSDVVGHGHIGAQGGGPLLSGHPNCKHFIGKDRDDVSIRSGHLSRRTLFIDDGGNRDAPLHFETQFEDGGDLEFPVPVHLGYDKASKHSWMGGEIEGMWRWWTTSLVERTPVYTPPVIPTLTPTDEPEPEPPPPTITPGLGSGVPEGSASGVSDLSSQDPLDPEGYTHTAGCIATPGIFAKPQRAQSGAGDVRAGNMTPDARSEYRRTTPVTGRIEAYGAQGGSAGGPYLTAPPDADGWTYTYRPGDGRIPTGSASGGWIITPPEVGIESVDDDFEPTGVSRSTVTFLAGPGARLGCGLPELATGGVKTGATFEANGSDIKLRRYGSDGTETSESDKNMLDWVEFLTDTNDFGTTDLNEVSSSSTQKQMGIRTDAAEEKLQFNIDGNIGTVGMGACAGFAGIYNSGTDLGQAVVTGVAEQVTQFVTNFSKSKGGATADATNHKITLQPGVWAVWASLSGESDTNNTNVNLLGYLDGSHVDMLHGERKFGTGGDYGFFALSGLVLVDSADEDLEIWVEADKDCELTFDECSLMAVQIADAF